MTGRPGRWRALAPVLALALAAGGCGGPGAAGGAGRLTVFAAASLTEAFTGIGEAYEAAHPGTEVTFSFGSSAALAEQIVAGAPADVLAAASPETMRRVTDAGAADGAPVVFARNRLVIAVPRDNPAGVGALADLARPGVTVALCAPQVPCGAAAARALDLAGVAVTPVTLEQDVRATLAKVRLGEVDAALVYRTDVAAAGGEVVAVDFPESVRAVNDYPVAALAGAPDPEGARSFVGFVRSAPARRVLADAGFTLPDHPGSAATPPATPPAGPSAATPPGPSAAPSVRPGRQGAGRTSPGGP